MKSQHSSLKNEAFVASIQSLAKNIEAYGPEIIGLEDDEKLDWTAAGRASASLCIVTEQLPPWPILCPEDASYCRDDPQVTLDVMGRALDNLAFTRAWKKSGTKAPPVSLIGTCQFTLALLETYGIKAQDFADSVWSVSKIRPRYSEGPGWRSAGNRNKLIGTDFDGCPIESLPAGSPWMAGGSNLSTLTVEALELGANVVVRWFPHQPNIIEVRFDSQIPNAMAASLVGKSFADVLDHPLTKRIEAKVLKIQQLKRSTRISMRIIDEGPKKLGNDLKPRAAYQRERKRLANARKQLQFYALRQLTPPVARADELLVDSNVDKLGI
jgi:hypothetical protein